LLETIFLNIAITVLVGHLASLTISSTGRATRREVAMRLVICAAGAVAMMLYPTHLGSGAVFDLRNTPIIAMTFAHGPVFGLVSAVPALAYRVSLGGAGVLPTFVSVLLAVLITTTLRRRVRLFQQEPHEYWWAPLLVFGLPPLAILLLPGGWGYFRQVYLPMVAGYTVSFLLLAEVIRTRVRLLELARESRALANLDAITGLANRRQFESDLAVAGAEGHLLVMDLDHFKRVNDTFGHDVGDRVLLAAAGVIEGCIRVSAGDRAYRLGGEEFAVFIMGCSARQAWSVAERIRRTMPGGIKTRVGRTDVTVTVSGGLVGLNGGKPRERLVLADTLLYESKRGGRDRVTRDADLEREIVEEEKVRRTMLTPSSPAPRVVN
jgi:diguanylate cyclase